MSVFLELLGKKIKSQNNFSTSLPYLVVVQSLEVVGVVDPDFYCGSQDDVRIEIEKDPDDDEKEPMSILYKWVDKNWFFTEEEAQNHIKANRHHYKEPRTYIKHCFRNYEMEYLFKEIGAIDKK